MYNLDYMVKNTLEIGEKRVKESLEFINRFGWLSSVELGKYFWKESTKEIRNISLSQLLKKLVENKLVALRQLPGKNGKAIVLLTAGVRYLKNLNITASNGKDIGSFDDFGNWIPPRNWQHDLISQRFLMAHASIGNKFLTERELRQSKVESNSLISRSVRYPDGLLFLDDDFVLALETENAQKTGYKRNAMVDNIVKTFHGKADSFNGHSPDFVIVLAAENSKIDHKKNIINALKSVINDDVEFYFATSSNEFIRERIIVENDEIKRILHKLRHLQLGEEGDCELSVDHNRFDFKIELSKFKKIYTWSVFNSNNLLETESSAESFLKVKEDIAVAILNNSRK